MTMPNPQSAFCLVPRTNRRVCNADGHACLPKRHLEIEFSILNRNLMVLASAQAYVCQTHRTGVIATQSGDVIMLAKTLLHLAAEIPCYGQAKDAASNAAEAVKQSASEADDFVRKTIEQHPYTVALAAFGLGWLVARMGRGVS
jgi:hypothetical protein